MLSVYQKHYDFLNFISFEEYKVLFDSKVL